MFSSRHDSKSTLLYFTVVPQRWGVVAAQVWSGDFLRIRSKKGLAFASSHKFSCRRVFFRMATDDVINPHIRTEKESECDFLRRHSKTIQVQPVWQFLGRILNRSHALVRTSRFGADKRSFRSKPVECRQHFTTKFLPLLKFSKMALILQNRTWIELQVCLVWKWKKFQIFQAFPVFRLLRSIAQKKKSGFSRTPWSLTPWSPVF